MNSSTAGLVPARKNKAPRIAFVDIETSPNLGYVWAKYEQDVLEYKKEWTILAFAVKYLGEKKVHTYGLPDFPMYKKDRENDRDLVKKLWEVFDGADVVVAHNGDRFDIPKANARFIFHGLDRPSPFKAMDTKKMAKRSFMFNSNKLDDLGEYLNVGRKLSTGGFSLWMKCMSGDKKAWAKMKKYNGQDVVLLEKIYLKFLPWSTGYANMNVLNGTTDNCPRCDGAHMTRRGFWLSATGRQQKLQCQDCGGWATGKAEKAKGTVVR